MNDREWKADGLVVRQGDHVVCLVAVDDAQPMPEALALAQHIAEYAPGSAAVKKVDLANSHDAVLTLAQAQKAFNDAWHLYYETLVPLPDDRFWELCGRLTEEVWQYRFGYKRSNGVKQGCWEFFRKAITGESERKSNGNYTLDEAFRFAKTYEDVVAKVSRRWFDVVDNRGDDSYGDLCDSLPLMGRECLTIEAMSCESFERQVAEHFRGEREKMGKFVLEGENYVEMGLGDAGKQAWRMHMLDQARKRDGDDAVPDVMFDDGDD